MPPGKQSDKIIETTAVAGLRNESVCDVLTNGGYRRRAYPFIIDSSK